MDIKEQIKLFDLNAQYYYQNPLIDKYPVPVKIISSLSLHRGVVEINRDFEARAGFFVNINQLTSK